MSVKNNRLARIRNAVCAVRVHGERLEIRIARHRRAACIHNSTAVDGQRHRVGEGGAIYRCDFIVELFPYIICLITIT